MSKRCFQAAASPLRAVALSRGAEPIHVGENLIRLGGELGGARKGPDIGFDVSWLLRGVVKLLGAQAEFVITIFL